MIPNFLKNRIEIRFGKKIRYPKDCISLSLSISRVCNEKVSASTLKRIFGLQYNTKDLRLYTLDLISRFAGFDSYDEVINGKFNYYQVNQEKHSCVIIKNLELDCILQILFNNDEELQLKYVGDGFLEVLNASDSLYLKGSKLNVLRVDLFFSFVPEFAIANGERIDAIPVDEVKLVSEIIIRNPIKGNRSGGSNASKKDVSRSMELMTATIDLNKCFIETNVTWREQLEYTEEELFQLDLSEVFQDSMIDLVCSRRPNFESGESIRDYFTSYLTKSGKKIEVLGSISPRFVSGVFSGWNIAVKKIDDLKVDVEVDVLERIATNFSKKYNSSLFGCVVIDYKFDIHYVNTVTAARSNMRSEDFIGRNMFDIFPGFKGSRIYYLYSLALRKKIRIEFSESYKYLDGKTRYLDFIVEPVNEGLFILSKEIHPERQ